MDNFRFRVSLKLQKYITKNMKCRAVLVYLVLFGVSLLGSNLGAGLVVHAQTTQVKTFTNQATVSASQPDPNLSNNTSSVTDQISVTVQTPKTDLRIEKIVDKSTALPADTLHYTLSYKNFGPDTAVQTIITDIIPPQASFISSTPNIQNSNQNSTLSFNLGDLVSGAEGKIEIYVKVKSGATGDLINAVNISSQTPEPDLSNNRSEAKTSITPNFFQIVTVRTGGIALTGIVAVGSLIVTLGIWKNQRQNKFKNKIQLK